MLQAIHDKITGWVAGLVIGLITVPFVFWGIDVGFGKATYAAKVKTAERPFWKHTEISIGEVQRAFQIQLNQVQMSRGEIPAELKTQIGGALLDQFIQVELLTQHTQDLGYRVAEDALTRSIEQIEQFQIDGKYNEQVAMRLLSTQGISADTFKMQKRRELQIDQLQNAIFASSFVTPVELERQRALEKEERELAWTVIPAES